MASILRIIETPAGDCRVMQITLNLTADYQVLHRNCVFFSGYCWTLFWMFFLLTISVCHVFYPLNFWQIQGALGVDSPRVWFVDGTTRKSWKRLQNLWNMWRLSIFKLHKEESTILKYLEMKSDCISYPYPSSQDEGSARTSAHWQVPRRLDWICSCFVTGENSAWRFDKDVMHLHNFFQDGMAFVFQTKGAWREHISKVSKPTKPKKGSLIKTIQSLVQFKQFHSKRNSVRSEFPAWPNPKLQLPPPNVQRWSSPPSGTADHRSDQGWHPKHPPELRKTRHGRGALIHMMCRYI